MAPEQVRTTDQEGQNAVRDVVHEVIRSMAPGAPGAPDAPGVARAEIGDETELRSELAYDSVRLIELSMVLEKQFSLPQLDTAEAATVSTVGDVVRLVLNTRKGE